MIEATKVRTGMAVAAPDGAPIGTVTAIHDAIVEIAPADGTQALRGRPFVPLACVATIRDDALVVEPHALTTIEAVVSAIGHGRAHGRTRSGGSLFGTSGHGTGMGGASVGSCAGRVAVDREESMSAEPSGGSFGPPAGSAP